MEESHIFLHDVDIALCDIAFLLSFCFVLLGDVGVRIVGNLIYFVLIHLLVCLNLYVYFKVDCKHDIASIY